jgi:peptidoglycan/xylan/chitin deacetylase (PgdA/CDA1 family)
VSGPIVLCYHAISPSWDAALSTPAERLEAQIGRLKRRGWTGLTLSEALADPRPRTYAITFDDAFESVATRARPVLDSLGVPATVYVPTRYPTAPPPMAWEGTDHWVDTPHAGELRCLSWDALRELADHGWEIGAHTVSHPHLTRLDDEALAHELSASKADCERELGRPCTSLAYPYGDVDDRVEEATRAAGYEFAVSLAIHEPKPLRWPRVGVYHVDSGLRERLKLSPLVYRLRLARS